MNTILCVVALGIGIFALAVRGEPAVSTLPGDLVSAGEHVEKIAGNMGFLEGPVWSKEDGGYLIFSDIPKNSLMKWSSRQGLTVFQHPSNGSNGNVLDGQGRLVSCEQDGRRVARREADGSVSVPADSYNGKKLNSPNDVVVKSDGTIWFTDPPYGIKPEQKEQDHNYVFCVDPESKKVTAVAEDFDRPNGLCFSPDESKLYIADSGEPHHIRVFDVKGNKLENGRVFITLDNGIPDGIRCDEKGNVWSSAGDGIHIFSAEGKLLGKIIVPETPANLCFGGVDGHTLFITARSSLYAIRVHVSGAGYKN